MWWDQFNKRDYVIAVDGGGGGGRFGREEVSAMPAFIPIALPTPSPTLLLKFTNADAAISSTTKTAINTRVSRA